MVRRRNRSYDRIGVDFTATFLLVRNREIIWWLESLALLASGAGPVGKSHLWLNARAAKHLSVRGSQHMALSAWSVQPVVNGFLKRLAGILNICRRTPNSLMGPEPITFRALKRTRKSNFCRESGGTAVINFQTLRGADLQSLKNAEQ